MQPGMSSKDIVRPEMLSPDNFTPLTFSILAICALTFFRPRTLSPDNFVFLALNLIAMELSTLVMVVTGYDW